MTESVTEVKTITQTIEVGKKIICDCCEKVIAERTKESNSSVSANCFAVTTGHYDWGNDSCDSIEHHDYCSVECLQKAFDKYYKIEKDGQHGSAYFEVSHKDIRL